MRGYSTRHFESQIVEKNINIINLLKVSTGAKFQQEPIHNVAGVHSHIFKRPNLKVSPKLNLLRFRSKQLLHFHDVNLKHTTRLLDRNHSK